MRSPSDKRKSETAAAEPSARTGPGGLDLSVILVSYNVKEFLEQALVSVQNALGDLRAEIIVVDNASHDGSAALLRQKFPQVQLIANPENLGFARACNQGLRQARGRYRVLLNPDTVVQEDTFSKMIAFCEAHPDTGLLGCKILNPDGSLQLACRRSFPTPWVAFTRLSGLSRLFPNSRLFGRYNLTYLDPDESYEVEAVSGSMMMVRAEVLDDVGYLDESFFMYGEDLDWCYRIRAGGWKVRYFAGTQIIHFKGESSKKAEFDRLRMFYQAMILFVKKHFKTRYLLMPYWLLWAAIWLRAGVSFALGLAKTLALPFTDLSVMTLSLVLSVRLWFGDFQNVPSFVPIMAVYLLVWLGLLTYLGAYGKHKLSASRSGLAILLGFFVNASLLFFFKQFAYSRAWVLLGGLFCLLTVPGWRLLLKLAPKLGWLPPVGKSVLTRSTLIVGEGEPARRLAHKLSTRVRGLYDVKGLVSVNGEAEPDSGKWPVLGRVEELDAVVRENKIQEVIFSTHELSYHRILEAIARTADQRVNFKLAPSHRDIVIGKASIERMDDVPLLEIDYRLHRPGWRRLKRAFDLSVAVALLPLAVPVYACKRWLWRQPLRSQQILGPGRNPLTVYAFEKGNFQKLPYLFSVLKGELSVVGAEIVPYEAEVSAQAQRELQLKPGLTGLAQINRSRGALSEEDREQYDLYYLKNYSPILDVEIVLKSLLRA